MRKLEVAYGLFLHEEEDRLVEEIDKLIDVCRQEEKAGCNVPENLKVLEIKLKHLIELRKKIRGN